MRFYLEAKTFPKTPNVNIVKGLYVFSLLFIFTYRHSIAPFNHYIVNHVQVND
jgi:hypothetical protein